MFFLQQGIGRIANFKGNLEKPKPSKPWLTLALQVLEQGDGDCLSLAQPGEADFWGGVPKPLPVRTRSISRDSSAGSWLSCPRWAAPWRWEKILMGTSPPCPLPVAVVLTAVSKGSWASHGGGRAGLWAARGCRQGGRGACGTQEGMKAGYPGAEEKEMMDLVSVISHGQHMRGLVRTAVQASPVRRSGLGFVPVGLVSPSQRVHG